MSLNRVEKALNSSTTAYENERPHLAFKHILECLNVLPHKSAMSEAEFPPSIILKRYKLEAFANEILANIYHQNSMKDNNDSAFQMKNATNSDQMQLFAIKSWDVIIDICEKFPLESDLQICHLRIIPTYLSIAGKFEKISQQQTISKILQMLKISKALYDDFSLERGQIFNSVIDLMVIYCPANIKLLQTISTDILYNCSRPISSQSGSGKAQKLIVNARTKLLGLWEKQSWTATLQLCEKIAISNVSVMMRQSLEYLCQLRFDELPERELCKNLRFFEKKFEGERGDADEAIYCNLVIIRKLIRSHMFVRAAKIIARISQKQLSDGMRVHLRCLEKLFVECDGQKTMQY